MILRLLLGCALATPIAAECPVGDDLATGIRVELDDGTIETYRSFRPGVVEIMATFTDATQSRMLLGQGVYMLQYATLVDDVIDPGSRTSFAFEVPAADLPRPDVGGRDAFKTVILDGFSPVTEDIVATWGDEASVTYGTCKYRLIPGVLTYENRDFGHEEAIHFLPELGIGLLHSYVDTDMDDREYYEVDSISRVVK